MLLYSVRYPLFSFLRKMERFFDGQVSKKGNESNFSFEGLRNVLQIKFSSISPFWIRISLFARVMFLRVFTYICKIWSSLFIMYIVLELILYYAAESTVKVQIYSSLCKIRTYLCRQNKWYSKIPGESPHLHASSVFVAWPRSSVSAYIW